LSAPEIVEKNRIKYGKEVDSTGDLQGYPLHYSQGLSFEMSWPSRNPYEKLDMFGWRAQITFLKVITEPPFFYVMPWMLKRG
jgi:hypothetical protein